MKHKYNAHNQYLESWMDAGVAAFLLLVLILIFFLQAAYRQQNVTLALISLFFFLSMLTESMLERHWGISLLSTFILFLGLAPPNTQR